MPKKIIETVYKQSRNVIVLQKSWGKQKICHKLDWTPTSRSTQVATTEGRCAREED